ncbi:SDR family NAD(P)-dependent oxidoreductase [Fulvimonas soli]|uniref:Glucose 1-dehydrogenase/3-oxoacyl-[acyl-carrier protein] reductase n=1 Tax=Fulvimonas soli TaxID=155197 RepID=A0A316IN60_9GAMM|nr:SDR family oxidoreductase [Fulvimonas soli]PWK91928.1 glucose 1-dehydrogenase/3-oxoacyl-[acyl-carrier protein] reductase [Fulvimonas soli]TNY26053.1 oxidoreductase [Fulvimonas soli]
MGQRFKDKVAFIIGGGRGMGRAIAEAFAAEGACVVISARTEVFGRQTVADFRARGYTASLVSGDIADRAAVRRMFEDAVAQHGRLDIVVNVAADAALGHVRDMEEDAYDYLIRSNVHALFWVARDAAPHLAKARDKGRLIYISSAAANRTFMPGLTAYAATKAYLNHFARGLAVELAPLGILVNVVEPGMIETDRMQSHVTAEQAAAIAAGFPVPRPGQASEIAAAVLFLAAPETLYITGSALLVDGGCSLVPMPGLSARLT